MADFDYWQKQGERAIFTAVDTMRPEQRRLAGKLLLVGGNKGMFFAMAQAMREAEAFGVGECRAVLPDSLKNVVPNTPSIYFAEAEASGAFGQKALAELRRQAEWADVVVLVGDLGKNGETSVAMAEFLADLEKPVCLMRDAIDVVLNDASNWAMREGRTMLLATLPQLQKLLRALYYPKMVTLSMPTNQLVELLHKFTLSYGLSLATLHNEQLIVAQDGKVVSTSLKDTKYTPIMVFDGSLLVKMAVLALWNEGRKDLETMATALVI